MSLTDFFVNDCHVEEGSGVSLLIDSNLQIMNSPIRVFTLMIEQQSDIKVGLEVLRISVQRPMIERKALLEVALSWHSEVLNARGDSI